MMKKMKFRALLCTLLTVVLMFGSTLTVFAANSGTNGDIKNYLSTSDTVATSVKNQFQVTTSPDDSKYGVNWNVYTRQEGSKTYYYYIEKTKESSAVSVINQALKNAQASEDIKDITSGLDIEADTGTATTILSGFTGIISTILGLMVVLISIGMTIFSAFDLCYIAFPVFRNKCEEAKQTGQGIMASNKTNKQTGETKLRFVSDDAQYAVVAADTVQSGKNPFVIYFSKRILSYVVLSILLFILLTGNITVFTSLALKVVSGILELIANF